MEKILLIIIIPLVISILAAFVYDRIKNRKKEYRITYTKKSERQYYLSEQGGVKISISYNGKDMTKPLSVYRLSIVNTGQKDIFFKQRFSSGVKIEHPELEFIDVRIININSKAKPEVFLNEDKSANLSWDILKRNESIELEIVANHIDQPFFVQEENNDFIFTFRSDCMDSFIKKPTSYHTMAVFPYVIGALYLILLSLIPMADSVQIDASINGKTYHNAQLSQNNYSHKFSIYSIDGSNTYDLSQIHDMKISIASNPREISLLMRFAFVFGVAIVILLILNFILSKAIKTPNKKLMYKKYLMKRIETLIE